MNTTPTNSFGKHHGPNISIPSAVSTAIASLKVNDQQTLTQLYHSSEIQATPTSSDDDEFVTPLKRRRKTTKSQPNTLPSRKKKAKSKSQSPVKSPPKSQPKNESFEMNLVSPVRGHNWTGSLVMANAKDLKHPEYTNGRISAFYIFLGL